MNWKIDDVFEAWWQLYGMGLEQKLGFEVTKQEIAKYAFKAGWRTAGLPSLKALMVPEGELDAESYPAWEEQEMKKE